MEKLSLQTKACVKGCPDNSFKSRCRISIKKSLASAAGRVVGYKSLGHPFYSFNRCFIAYQNSHFRAFGPPVLQIIYDKIQGYEIFQCAKGVKIQIFPNVLHSQNFKSLNMFSGTGMIIFTFETEQLIYLILFSVFSAISQCLQILTKQGILCFFKKK